MIGVNDTLGIILRFSSDPADDPTFLNVRSTDNVPNDTPDPL